MAQQRVARVEVGERELHRRVVPTLAARKRLHVELVRVEGNRVIRGVAAAHRHPALLPMQERQGEQHRSRVRFRLHAILLDKASVRLVRHAL